MKYAIVYSSKTGNTAALADRLHDILPHEHCVYFGDTSHYSPELGGATLSSPVSGPIKEAVMTGHGSS